LKDLSSSEASSERFRKVVIFKLLKWYLGKPGLLLILNWKSQSNIYLDIDGGLLERCQMTVG